MLTISHYEQVTRIEMARSIMGRGWYWTTAYLIGQTLIDSGPAHTAGELSAYLLDVPIKQILNTHAHEDHIGANGSLQRQRENLEIYAHPDAIPIIQDPVGKQPLQAYRRLMWGWPQPSQAQAINQEDTLPDGEFQLEVMHTPGHTDHHLCFYEPQRGWLFSGDLFIGGRDRALGAGNDIWKIISSLKRLERLPLQILFPGSARIRRRPSGELRARIQYLEDLCGKVLKLQQSGWDEARIARKLLGGPMLIEFFTGGHFSRRHLVRSILNPTSFSNIQP